MANSHQRLFMAAQSPYPAGGSASEAAPANRLDEDGAVGGDQAMEEETYAAVDDATFQQLDEEEGSIWQTALGDDDRTLPTNPTIGLDQLALLAEANEQQQIAPPASSLGVFEPTAPTMPPQTVPAIAATLFGPPTNPAAAATTTPTTPRENHSNQRSTATRNPPPNNQQRVAGAKRKWVEPKPRSAARRQYDASIQEQTLAQQHLEETSGQIALLQSNLPNLQRHAQQAQENSERILKQVYLDIIREEDNSWYLGYQRLLTFQAQHGHTAVPRSGASKKEHAQLSRWVGINRTLHRQGQLSNVKEFALRQVEFDFDPSDTKWRTKYQELVDFVKEHGHAKVPYRSNGNSSEKGSTLGAWVKRQQYQYTRYQEGRPSDLTANRIKLLEDVGMVWKRREESWMERYQELRDHFERHGNLHVKDNRTLNEWVSDQRRQLKKQQHEATTLTPKQVQLLQEIGLDIDARDTKWHSRLEQLVQFRKLHGHTLVPNKYPLNQELANWVGTQRRQYRLLTLNKKSQLTKDRVQELKDIGFEFDVPLDRRRQRLVSNSEESIPDIAKTWEECYTELELFSRQRGHCNVPPETELGQWCLKQRHLLQEGRPDSFTKQQRERLALVGIAAREHAAGSLLSTLPTSPRDGTSWEEQFGDLLAYRVQSNSFEVPIDQHPELARFVNELQREYVKFSDGLPSTLTHERVQKLLAVKFPLTSGTISTQKAVQRASSPSWEERFVELLQFRLQAGSFDVPRHNAALCRWVQNQRSVHQRWIKEGPKRSENNSFLERRFAKLDSLNFPWECPSPTTPCLDVRQLVAPSTHNNTPVSWSNQKRDDDASSPLPANATLETPASREIPSPARILYPPLHSAVPLTNAAAYMFPLSTTMLTSPTTFLPQPPDHTYNRRVKANRPSQPRSPTNTTVERTQFGMRR